MRHQGFIPWDDDLDVAMMREDFEKLCLVPKEEWGECSFCYGASGDARHDKIFGRVYWDGSRIQSKRDLEWRVPSTGEPFYTSLMCDIYIFDELPDDEAEYRRNYKHLKTIATRRYKWAKYRCLPSVQSGKKKLSACLKMGYGIGMRRLHKEPWQYLDACCRDRAVSSRPGHRIGTYITDDPYCYAKEDYFPLTRLPFEDMEVPAPKNYEQVLCDMYGDYRKYPPESERLHIPFIYVDLGDGREWVIDPAPQSLGDPKRKK